MWDKFLKNIQTLHPARKALIVCCVELIRRFEISLLVIELLSEEMWMDTVVSHFFCHRCNDSHSAERGWEAGDL